MRVQPEWAVTVVSQYAAWRWDRVWMCSFVNKHQILCPTQKIGNVDPWDALSIRPWSNEPGKVFWVAFTLQEGQNVTGGCREVRAILQEHNPRKCPRNWTHFAPGLSNHHTTHFLFFFPFCHSMGTHPSGNQSVISQSESRVIISSATNVIF